MEPLEKAMKRRSFKKDCFEGRAAKKVENAYSTTGGYYVVDADLPRTRTRKIKRKDSRQILEKIINATAIVSKQKSSEGVSVTIVKAVASVTGTKAGEIHSATMLREDLGFDSLMAVELASVLSNIGKGRFDPDDIAKCETIADLVDLVGLKGELTQRKRTQKRRSFRK